MPEIPVEQLAAYATDRHRQRPHRQHEQQQQQVQHSEQRQPSSFTTQRLAIMAAHFLLAALLALIIAEWNTAALELPPAHLELQPNPKVCAPAGCLLGRRMPGYKTDEFEAFLGVPYALPPVDELRFSNPKTFPKWSGVRNASTVMNDCIQKNYLIPNPQVYGSEDCLYLNIYRPIVSCKEKLPVMVYIFGGGWFSGSASPALHGPEYFMDTKAVILVTVAYRLGALGFLSTNDSHMAGNFGLKDQNLALRWVQRNIGAFGGNAKKVTIFGQSAGAISAHMHMLSKQSVGLFHHVILLSGTANVPFGITEQPLAQAVRIAELCDIRNASDLSTAKLTRALRGVNATALVNAGDGLKYWDVDHLTNYRPVVEHCNESDAFLTQHPNAILASGQYNHVPVLMGGVPQEGAVRVLAILANETLKADFNVRFNELFGEMMDLPAHFNATEREEKVNQIIEEYFQGQHELNNATGQGFLDTVSDRGFKQPFFNTIKTYVNSVDTSKYPVYLYQFNYSGPYSYASIYTGMQHTPNVGVVHCDDLIYLFRSPMLFPDFDKNSTHAAVVAAFVNNFVHFAQHGMPKDFAALRPCNNITFNSAPNTICDYQHFTNDMNSFAIKTDNAYNVGRMNFWSDLLH